MPSLRSSPPPRMRSPGLPVLDTPPMPRRSPRRSTSSLPPSPSPKLPSSPRMHFSPPPTPVLNQDYIPNIARSGSSSSASSAGYSSGSSSSSQRVSTPPPPPARRSKTNSKLLPALPLSIHTTPPRSRRAALDFTEVEVVVERAQSLRSQRPIASSTPPRPPRRESELLAPNPPYARSISPCSTSSVSTVSEASTPRATTASNNDSDRASEAGVNTTLESTPMGRKRDSAQRRLSALRGLVANLDFNQPWSISEQPETEEVQDAVWACGGEPIVLRETILHPVNQDHGWPTKREEVLNITPVRQASLPRNPHSTPPRRRGMTRSNSDLHFRTPEPPRPTRLARTEVFGVASSGYSKSLEPSSPCPSTPTPTWRSSLASDETFHRVMQNQGPMEVKRQEIMWEMCETEQAFVKSMRTILRLFAIPLKTPQGKWIHGIPSKITDLFDSLEGVAHAHGIIAAIQRDMRRKSEVLDISSFIGMFKQWVHRMEVHESYLLKFEAVVQLVEDNVRDPESVFGEFVRMQMKDEVLGNMSLGSMLLKPVQRLTKYPLFLKATKAREEDFEQLQALEAKLQGLPDGFTLAIRGRKLIGQGLVTRILPSKDLSPSASRGRAGSLHSSRGSISSTVSSSAPSTTSSSPWDFTVLTPSTCRTSAFSVSSTPSSSYQPPSRSNSITHSSPCRPSMGRSPSLASIFASSDRPSTPSSSTSRSRKKEEVLTMFIFDDLVIVAIAGHEKSAAIGLFTPKKRGDKVLRVLSEYEGGIGKVLDAKDWSGWQGHGSMFALTLLPFTPSIQPCTTAYTLPTQSSPKKNTTLQHQNHNCPTLSTITQFITSLAQATSTATSAHTVSPGAEPDHAFLQHPGSMGVMGGKGGEEVLSGIGIEAEADGEWLMSPRTPCAHVIGEEDELGMGFAQ